MAFKNIWSGQNCLTYWTGNALRGISKYIRIPCTLNNSRGASVNLLQETSLCRLKASFLVQRFPHWQVKPRAILVLVSAPLQVYWHRHQRKEMRNDLLGDIDSSRARRTKHIRVGIGIPRSIRGRFVIV